MLISDRIFERMEQIGMPQKEFSALTGIPQSTISDWKSKGLNPSADRLIDICRALEVDICCLLSGAESDKYNMPQGIYISKDSEEYEVLMKYQSLSGEAKKKFMAYVNSLVDGTYRQHIDNLINNRQATGTTRTIRQS